MRSIRVLVTASAVAMVAACSFGPGAYDGPDVVVAPPDMPDMPEAGGDSAGGAGGATAGGESAGGATAGGESAGGDSAGGVGGNADVGPMGGAANAGAGG